MKTLMLTDGYKVDHRRQYPKGTTLVYSNWTARTSRLENVNEVMFFGLQYFMKKYLIDDFNNNFFKKPKDEVVGQYKRRIASYLGPDAITYEHVSALHDLGYLPMEIKAVPEGTLVPLKIPMLTIKNTKPDFFWLTNFFETVLSCVLWLPCTSATTAFEYRKMLDRACDSTGGIKDMVQWQGHDFSFRGMGGVEAAMMSGAAHLLSFSGTDTIPAIDFLEQYYGANSEKELIGGSVPATEHSVMCMGMQDGEQQTFKRLIKDIYPSGIVSIVSDTWDFWKVITDYLPQLKTEIMARNGKVVIRPDSGDPVKIIVGDANAPKGSPEYKGAIQCLYETFGGTKNAKGFIDLDSHIGLIYGDSITLERAQQICNGLKEKGFSSTNVVLGIGSYTYQYVTRDVFGFAMKATYGEVNGKGQNIFKDPKTDSGVKKSAKGLMKLDYGSNGKIELQQEVTWDQEKTGLLKTVFLDGKITQEETLAGVRARVQEQLKKRI